MSKENILIGTINYGTRGRDGVGITDVVVNEDNTLTFHFSDGTEQTTSPILIDGSATNYESLGNLPRINSIEIKGNKTLEDYGLDLSNYYNKLEIDNTEQATELIINNKNIFKDYEIIKGRMDDVFLSATGYELEV